MSGKIVFDVSDTYDNSADNVGDLIRELKNYPQDVKVYITYDGELEGLRLKDMEFDNK